MSKIETWLSIVGSVVSIGGAIWAFIEARKASRSASKAEQVRDEIKSRRKLVEVSQIHTETSRILNVVSKVGPACNQSFLRGVNCGSIAKEVEEYSRYINERSSNFTDFLENKAKELCAELHPDIEALAEAKSFEDKKAAGKSIYYKINNFLPFVKEISDERKESIAIG
ncbi:MAG: hypothetical protein H7X86_11180 [Gorillibacterium sp.]|nr:hypothetical protein [Gorillibacterium sp.]